MFIKKKHKLLGFTLIEVMVTLVLSVMVSFFVYTMMMSSYTAFRRLSSVSKNANSIRFFISSINNSMKNAKVVSCSSSELSFTRYDVHNNRTVIERYFFTDGGTIEESTTKSTKFATLNSQQGSSLGVLKKQVKTTSGTVLETIVVSNVIRAIYYHYTSPSATNRYYKLNLGVVYDDIVDGRQNQTTGKIEAKGTGGTEMATDYTLSRIILCFCSRGIQW